MNIVKTTAFLALLGTGQSFAQNPDFHIYLAFGQSNMEGAGTIESQDTQGIDGRLRNLSGVTCSGRSVGQWISATPPLARCSAGLSVLDYFGRTLTDSLPDHITIGIAVVAVPGAKIELFDKDNYKAYADTAPSWMRSYISEYEGYPYGRLLASGKKAKTAGTIKGILLHQGESNSGEGDAWLSKVRKVHNDLIRDLDLDASQVPLIAGELVGQKEGGACAYHNQTIAKLPEVIPNAHIVSSDGLAHQGDYLHFTSASYRTFGRRYAQTMLNLLKDIPEAPHPSSRDTILNGTFDQGSTGWTLNVWAGAATGSVEDSEYRLSITQIGTENHQIQLIQPGIMLVQDRSYEVTFDAYANTAHNLEVNIEQNTSPWNSYLDSLRHFSLSTTRTPYRFQFRMNTPTDSSSRISFNAGSSSGILYLDNIRIRDITLTPDNPDPTSVATPASQQPQQQKASGRFDLLGRAHRNMQ